MSMQLIDLKSDVLLCLPRFSPFYLYTFTFVVLDCVLVLFSVDFERPQKTSFHLVHLL